MVFPRAGEIFTVNRLCMSERLSDPVVSGPRTGSNGSLAAVPSKNRRAEGNPHQPVIHHFILTFKPQLQVS
jgi:hypothetical protein